MIINIYKYYLIVGAISLWQVFSDTCQRLLDAQRRIAQLEDELQGQAELQRTLESRLEGAKAQQTTKELEVRPGHYI